MLNPIEFKHDIASRPLKWLMSKPGTEWNDWYAGAVLLTALETAAINLLPAASLIQMGVRGEQYFSHVRYVKSAIGYPMPYFNYVQAASAAEEFGGRVGKKFLGKAGVKLGARIGGRLIPGVGWALLAYDVYDIAFNQSLWGFDLPI